MLRRDSPFTPLLPSARNNADPKPQVKPTDNPEDYVDTVRAWTIGILTCTVVAAMNVLLAEHFTSVFISSSVVQLISYPMGTGWARFVPAKVFRVFGREVHLNPGPFNKKEHTIITMMTAAGTSVSYAISILIAQQIFYGQSVSISAPWLSRQSEPQYREC